MMPNNDRIFVDSNFFIALFNPSDNLYQSALTISQKIKEENPKLVISNFIFLEIVTVLSLRINKEAAVLLGKHLLDDKQLEIVHIDKHLNDLTWEVFQKIKNKNMSFVDCSVLAVMRTEGINKFLIFDKKDFTTLQKEYRFSFYP